MSGGVLNRESIDGLVQASPPLVECYLSLKEQLQPNGFDLTLQNVVGLSSVGYLGQTSDQRALSDTDPLPFDHNGWIYLDEGPYIITFNEIVNLPLNLMALGRSRSSLLRCGVSIHNAVWDAGYRGRSQALMVVYNTLGYRVQKGARLMQLVFFQLNNKVKEGYSGRYMRENI
jgi:dUTP pyrophosphatase